MARVTLPVGANCVCSNVGRELAATESWESSPRQRSSPQTGLGRREADSIGSLFSIAYTLQAPGGTGKE